MNLRNDSYLILIGTRSATERHFRDKKGWIKVSTHGRTFRATAEQVLNHVLPALAGHKANVTIRVEHYDDGLPALPTPEACASLGRSPSPIERHRPPRA